jgi:uncharacterized protein (DUF362 family)/Pyruvate/2-oxoacid:ferredoxin oxidoreductase delta subunit
LVREAGAAWIGAGDSPGFGSGRAAAKKAGYDPVFDECGIEWVEFTATESIDPMRRYRRLEVAKELLEADVVINLPKAKTHGQMRLTLAVKNLFGAVVGMEKVQWHYRAGRDARQFARLITEVCRAISPALSIVDGVWAMDGMGPTGGQRNDLHLLAAGADPWAVDAAMTDFFGLPRMELFTLAAAKDAGWDEWENVRVVGDDPATSRPASWNIPELWPIGMHGKFLNRFPRLVRWLETSSAAPPVATEACVKCNRCVGLCPADAIKLTEKAVSVDAGTCIRCYCCHELCPHGAMAMGRRGWLARLFRRGRAGAK